MGISTERDWRQHLIFFSILLMLLALFTSRVLLSIGMMAFLFLTCFHKNFSRQLTFFATQKLLAGIACLFLIPVITWFWSSNQPEWFRWARIKLPLFLLPLAFAGSWQLSASQWRLIACFFLLLVGAGCGWSLWHYLQHPGAVQLNYLKAKILATPLGNDHVRFSLLVSIAVVVAVLLFQLTSSKKYKIILTFAIGFYIIFLHILSARTGLVSLYIFLALGIFYSLSKSTFKWSIAAGVCVLLLPLAAWWWLPTFQNRFRYMLYDFSFIQKDSYLPGTTDGNRWLSLRAGWNILMEHPFGVGSGDVMDTTYQWYHQHQSQMLETDKLYPSSEWLLYGDAAGWPGIIFFSCIMLLFLFEKTIKHRFFWTFLNIISGLSFLFDIGLEAQFGVFIYGFIILCWWKWEARGNGTIIESSIVINRN